MEGLNLNALTSSISRRTSAAPARSLIDAWLTVTGNLKSDGEVTVEGRVDGDIRCSHLVVAKDAHIAGGILADEVIVRGKVRGTIRADRVTLQDTAVVEGDIYHRTLRVEQGACFEGSCKRCEAPMAVDLPTAGVDLLKSAAADMKDAITPPGTAGEAAA